MVDPGDRLRGLHGTDAAGLWDLIAARARGSLPMRGLAGYFALSASGKMRPVRISRWGCARSRGHRGDFAHSKFYRTFRAAMALQKAEIQTGP